MIAPEALTDEQLRIVRHHEGPAVVFAVAGAGKTTAVVHRVRRLVDERGVDPEDILASSFGRTTVMDLEGGTRELGVSDVDCRTLHSLGRQFVRMAEVDSLWPHRLDATEADPERLSALLAGRARSRLAQEQGLDERDLGIEQRDLVEQIGAWKAQLCYPDLEEAGLPDRARRHASQAEHDNEDFVTLYRYYEKERAREGWITFDDMLLEGWEALMRFDEVRGRVQTLYEHVLVDEFQDISPVQYRMLDVLTEPHHDDARRNYMAIGDGDQCIYEWRGADPSLLWNFREEYGGEEYRLSDNFRSRAQQTALANAVIAEKKRQHEKHINLTRGFGGRTRLVGAEGAAAEAEQVVETIQARLKDGRPAGEMAILVRQYAQTPFIEQGLIDEEIPHRIVGNVPFYRRREVQALLRYLFWGTLEATVRTEGWFEDRRRARRYVDRFQKILREPNRYVSTDTARAVSNRALSQQASVAHLLAVRKSDMHPRTAERVGRFLDTADALVERLADPAYETVEWLIDDLDYETHIRQRSAFEETAERRVNTARSLVEFARGHPDAQSLLDHVKRLAVSRTEEDFGEEAVDIRSIHRAKGQEWPVVIVPECNEGTIPARRTETTDFRLDAEEGLPLNLLAEIEETQAEKGGMTGERRAEERRLFYVALTRAQEELFLFHDETDPRTSFLEEAQAEDRLSTCRALRAVMTTPPDEWDTGDTIRFVVGAGMLHLDRYLEKWWAPGGHRADEKLRRSVANRMREVEALETQTREEWASGEPKHSPEEETRREDAASIGGAPDQDPSLRGSSVPAEPLLKQVSSEAFQRGKEAVASALGVDAVPED